VSAPIGNSNAKRGGIWRDALQRALDRYMTEGIKAGSALNAIADKVVELALAGEKEFVQEIANRLDGKAHQSVALQIEDLRDKSREELLAAGKSLGIDEGLFDEPGTSTATH